MDLNFGEIVINQSRAIFDDYDVQESLQFNEPNIIWHIDECQRKFQENVYHLVVVEGINAKKVLKETILNSNLRAICRIRNVEIYEAEKSTLLCISEEQELNYITSICDSLNDFFKYAKNVTTISLQRISEFKTDIIPDGCVIKGINSNFIDVEQLRPPNFITGLTGAISAQRHLNDQSFETYVIYVDIFDEIAIKKILSHLQRIGLNCNMKVKIQSIEEKGNLYM